VPSILLQFLFVLLPLLSLLSFPAHAPPSNSTTTPSSFPRDIPSLPWTWCPPFPVEIEPKEGILSESTHSPASRDAHGASSRPASDQSSRRKQSSFKRAAITLEHWIGNQGPGHLDEVAIPPYDPQVSEVNMVLHTVEDGHNSGKSYSHRLPADSAQVWLNETSRCVAEAKARERKRQMDLVYGQGRLALYRTKCRHAFESNTFQVGVAFLIIFCFGLDLAEAQLLPERGSDLANILFGLDAATTCLFALELFINIFAHSNNHFEEFIARSSNWIDAFIVIMSVTNVLLSAANIELPNAKLLRLLRLGRVVRIFKSLKNLQKIISAASSAILPVCNAFFILLIIASVLSIYSRVRGA